MSHIPTIAEKDMEKYSSAITLSDMEIFVFPELMYSLLLANLMSPAIWRWRQDSWFRKMHKLTPYRRVLRLKQFIIDNFEFNLDLDTWGLTSQDVELNRFKSIMDPDIINRSNALFGYEGDKYYFDIDIRRHFGLDKYGGDTIPYWKTETVEAMQAFRHKEGYAQGAGECVSLAALYAAALFIVAEIPLENIFMMATPLHSQNFIDIADGLLTNNRRIVTKNMWFNGTELTAKAQRALRNENVTVVSHNSGYIHLVYPEATINHNHYERFKHALDGLLTTDIDLDILANFFRQYSDLQKCFQLEHTYHGKSRYIGLETVYRYEHASPYRVNPDTLEKLLQDIDEYAFYSEPIEGRISFNNLAAFLKNYKIDFSDHDALATLVREFQCEHDRTSEIINDLASFVHLKPRLPSDKQFIRNDPIAITTDMSREDIITYLESRRHEDITADLAFYAARDMSRIHHEPFIKAATERNPVSIEQTQTLSDQELIMTLEQLPNESIYEGARMAQPDEVWNYRRGDGWERAICLANIMKKRHPDQPVTVIAENSTVSISMMEKTITWTTTKNISKTITI